MGGLMSLPDLLHVVGYPHIDRTIAGVIAVYEVAFPERIRGYYLVGSLSRGTAGTNSDIDLEIVFKESFLTHACECLHMLRQPTLSPHRSGDDSFTVLCVSLP
jgi:hypothetical protein